MPYIRSLAAPPPGAAAATKSVIAPPSATLALDRLAVRGAVSVVSTWWAGEGSQETGRTRKMSRYAGAGASTFAPACTHQQPPSRHPTPPADAIHTSQGLRTSSCNTVGTTTTYGPPPYYVSHQRTTCPLSLSCVDLITLHQCPLESALGRLQLPKCRRGKIRPSSSGSRSNTATTDLTQPHHSPTHQHPPPHQHLAPPLPPVYTRPAPGFEPQEVA